MELEKLINDDIKHAKKINEKTWNSRPFYFKLGESIARLFSPAL